MKIGVFDSGVGGLSLAQAIEKAMPGHEVILREDSAHLPYGNKTPQQLLAFVAPIIDEMTYLGCDVIVIACNTVSTTIIGELRARFPHTVMVAVEPMIKPAANLTSREIIAVCATPVTLGSARYADLLDRYAAGLTVLEPDCSDWAKMIQDNEIDHAKIAGRINEVLDKGADVIVLGCTHYHWIETEIKQLCRGRAKVIQPEKAIIARLQDILADVY